MFIISKNFGLSCRRWIVIGVYVNGYSQLDYICAVRIVHGQLVTDLNKLTIYSQALTYLVNKVSVGTALLDVEETITLN